MRRGVSNNHQVLGARNFKSTNKLIVQIRIHRPPDAGYKEIQKYLHEFMFRYQFDLEFLSSGRSAEPTSGKLLHIVPHFDLGRLND